MYTLLGVCSTFIAGLLEHRLVKKRTYTHHRRHILIVFDIRFIKKRSTYMTINHLHSLNILLQMYPIKITLLRKNIKMLNLSTLNHSYFRYIHYFDHNNPATNRLKNLKSSVHLKVPHLILQCRPDLEPRFIKFLLIR